MISTLTRAERFLALWISMAVSICGMALAIAGRGDPLFIHGLLIVLFGLVCAYIVMFGYEEKAPGTERFSLYYDSPIKAGVVFAMIWAVFGMFMGVWVAAQLAWPDLAFDAPWSSLGRLRPTHTAGVIFGFGGNALIATSFHVVQRTPGIFTAANAFQDGFRTATFRENAAQAAQAARSIAAQRKRPGMGMWQTPVVWDRPPLCRCAAGALPMRCRAVRTRAGRPPWPAVPRPECAAVSRPSHPRRCRNCRAPRRSGCRRHLRQAVP